MPDLPSSAPGPRPAPARSRRVSGVVVPHRPNRHQRLAGWCVWFLIKTVAATMRFQLTAQSTDLRAVPGPVIFCLWHNRLPLCVTIYDRYLRGRVPALQGLAALVSASKDGAFLSGILEALGVAAVRGSSSRRGAQALLELSTRGQSGWDLAITPDGPRGPCYNVQEGIISLAQVTGLPIVPAAYHLNRKFCLKSWDRFQIPLPFSRCSVTIGAPIHVPREVTPEDRTRLRLELQAALSQMTID